MSLLPDRHPTRDFFIADIFDGLSIKDDMASMEHPIFSLSTKPDCRDLEYKNGDVTVRIKPNSSGLPTIFDKDVLLYCGSLLMAEVNKGVMPPKTLRVSVHDLLVTTNRTINGQSYKLLKDALDRLTGVTIETSIKTHKKTQASGFHLLENYDIIESSRVKDRMVRLEITVSDWFYNSIIGKEVLTINREYFRLRKPIERRLYELARKHCGNLQKEWRVSLESLQLKIGSFREIRKFRYDLRQIVENNYLPDYSIKFDDLTDQVIFSRRQVEEISSFPAVTCDIMATLSITPKTWGSAQKMLLDAGLGWDLNNLLEQYLDYAKKCGTPKNTNGAFIGFLKKKIKTGL